MGDGIGDKECIKCVLSLISSVKAVLASLGKTG